jgi:menaquinone-specific isochorismate synthase
MDSGSTATTGSTGLHARSVPLEYGPDALQFNANPTVLFDRPGFTLVGWGTALMVDAAEATEVLASIPCDDRVQRPGSGVVALGALPFEEVLSGQVIVPRFTMGIARDAGGETHRWLTVVGPEEDELPDTDEALDAVIWQYDTTPEGAEPPEVTVSALDTPMSSDGYRDLVARAVATMQAPDAPLRKVVLARPITIAFDGQLPLSVVLRRLRAYEPNCTVFCLPVPDGTFFGASPELLVARDGERVWCHPLAGTVARGTTARSDADAQGRLAGSPKEQSEHRYVIDDIAGVLRPLCSSLSVPDGPSLVAFRSVAHLGTRIEGRLAQPMSILELVGRMHPTAAVGGTPRDVALATILEGEPEARGYWAGPVGWTDAAGNGEWMIGLRSARLHTDGSSVSLHAGAGIVAGSDPEAEAAEVNVKLTTVLDALIPGGSAHLR